MSVSEAATADIMSNAIIPATVAASGPQFTKLPNELLIEIFKYAVMLDPDFGFDNAIDKDLFDRLSRRSSYAYLRLVSGKFTTLVMVAFYESNVFRFHRAQGWWIPGSPPRLSTTIPAALPPVLFRKHLRRVQICICIEDHYWTNQQGKHVGPVNKDGLFCCRITTVDELLTHSPSARQLFELTNDTTGCPGIKELDLHIMTKFEFINDVQTTLKLLAATGFSIKARRLNLKVTNMLHMTSGWHLELAAILNRK